MVQTAWENILKHQTFEKLADAPGSTFNFKLFKEDITGVNKSYKSHANFTKHSLLEPTSIAMPINPDLVKRMSNSEFKEPRELDEIVIWCDSATLNPMESKVAWSAISMEEPRFAVVLAVDRDIKAGVKQSVLDTWKQLLAKAPHKFVTSDGEDSKWEKASNLRELIGKRYAYMSKRANMRIVEIYQFKVREEAKMNGKKLSHQKCAELYCKAINVSPEAEQVTDSLVDQSLTVYARGLKWDQIQRLIRELDSLILTRSPWNSIGNMHAVITKAREKEYIFWAFESITDCVKSDLLKPEQINVRSLTGQGMGGRGLVDLFTLKKKMKMFMYSSPLVLERPHFSHEFKQKVREVLDNHDAYRSQFNVPDKTPVNERPNLTWKINAKASEKLALQLIDDAVYNNVYDGVLKSGIKASKGCEDILEYEPFKISIEAIEDAIKKEVEAVAAAKQDEAAQHAAAGSGNDMAEGQDETMDAATRSAAATKALVLDSNPLKQKIASQFEDDMSSTYWTKEVTRSVREVVSLIPECSSQTATKNCIIATPVNSVKGSGGYCVAIVSDVKQGGEAATAPHRRTAPFREEQHSKNIMGALESRGSAAEIQPNECVLMTDGGKHGLASVTQHFCMLTWFLRVGLCFVTYPIENCDLGKIITIGLGGRIEHIS